MRVPRITQIAAATAVTACLAVSAVAADKPADKKADDGWVPLFNGKDLSGWKMVNPPSGEFGVVAETKNADGKVIGYMGVLKGNRGDEKLWRVEDGMIVGGGHASHLFTESGDYTDFHFRVEVKINDGGNSGQYFRTEFGPGFPKGYEAQINATHKDPVKTGSLYPNAGLGLDKFRDQITVLNTAPIKPDEFYTQEVIAVGDEITIIVNGKTTLDHWKDPNKTFTKGHFALQGHDPGSVMTFRKVEYKPVTK